MKLRWRRINNILHRDLGYLFVGMTIIYGLSGIALNHINDWNPSYIIKNKSIQININSYDKRVDKTEAKKILESVNLDNNYKSHYYPQNDRLKIFVKNGSLSIDINTGEGTLEIMKRRPVFHTVNFMHYNPGRLWTWYSDIFSVSLIILAITGMFVLRGKKGIKGRGAILVTIGVIIPLVFILMYL